jgi:hypothetical protein
MLHLLMFFYGEEEDNKHKYTNKHLFIAHDQYFINFQIFFFIGELNKYIIVQFQKRID